MKRPERIAIFPGSFDPFTVGHEQIVYEALPLFDKLIVAVGHSLSKVPLLPLDVRIQAIAETFAAEKTIEVCSFQGLIVDFARSRGASYLVRGLRSSFDFDYELPMTHTNRALYPELKTLFFATAPEHSYISSTLVREVATKGGDFRPFVPKAFHAVLANKKSDNK